MKCKLLINLGIEGDPIELEFESDSSSFNPTPQDYFNAFTNEANKEIKEALLKIIEEKYNIGDNTVLDIEQIKDDPIKLAPNSSVQALANLNTNVSFPEGIVAPVLLVNNLKQGGTYISGRVLKQDGTELFIIQNNEDDIARFANFLTIRKTLQDNPALLDEYGELEKLRELYKKDTVADLILDFTEDRKDERNRSFYSDYRTQYFTDSDGKTQSVYVYLDNICRKILEKAVLKEFSDPFVSTIYRLHRKTKEKGNIKGKNDIDVYTIRFEELYDAVKAYHPEIIERLGVKDAKSFETLMKEDKNYRVEKDKDGNEKTIQFFDNHDENKALIYTLFEELTKSEPWYKFKIRSITPKQIRLESFIHNVKSRYGYSYSDAVAQSTLISNDEKGYKIYSINHGGKKYYIYSRHYITEDTSVFQEYESLAEVQQAIKEKALNEKLWTQSMIRLKARKKVDGKFENVTYLDNVTIGRQMLPEKSIIEVLDVKVDFNTPFRIEEELNIKNAEFSKTYQPTTQDVHNIIRGWNISENVKDTIIGLLDNSEKAMTYLYKINEILKEDRTNEQKLAQIARVVSGANHLYYYVNSRTSDKYKLIASDPNGVDSFKKNRQAPVLQLFYAIQQTMIGKANMKVPMKLMSAQEIANAFPASKFPGVSPNTSKAFIYNGDVYINTTIASGEDLLHEYVHIILGALRANPNTREHYEQLLITVASKSKSTELDYISKNYSEFSQMDKFEELFVKKFTEYLFPSLGTNTQEINDIFKQEEQFIQEGTKTIFDLLGNEDISTTYLTSIDKLFRRFSSDVSVLLNRKKGLDLDPITNSRRIQDWIRKEIKNKNIKELDCL